MSQQATPVSAPITKKVGVIMLPALFGTSLSFWWHCLLLLMRGYSVAVVDIYKDQKFLRPFFGKIVSGTPEERTRKIDELAAQLKEEPVIRNIANARTQLQTEGCTHVVILGYGMGGTMALKWLEDKPEGTVRGIVANSPHLVYPPNFPQERVAPAMGQVNVPCFFYGQHDDATPDSVAKAKELAGIREGGMYTLIFNAGHAFTDAFIQAGFPNPLYRPIPAWQAWRETEKIIDKLIA
jgi:dienelactone hydrolase